MNWQRARTDEKKNERKDAICQAAVTLFIQDGYENVSFNGIAAKAGFTKSNMYRYFSSREEIFLNIFSGLFDKWVDECCARLQKLAPNEEAKRFAQEWVNSLTSHPQFLNLCPVLFTSLEKNSSFEQLFAFKKLAKWLLYKVSIEIVRIYPELEGDKAYRLLTLTHAATSSYWAVNAQNDVLKQIYLQDEFKDMKPDFEGDLTKAIEVIIHGLKAT